MIDYMMKSLVPKLKSEVKTEGRRHWFHVLDDQERWFVCFNAALYDAIKLGEKIEVRIAEGKQSVITEVTGFKIKYPEPKVKRPRNEAEAQFFDLMVMNHWELSKKGWPDFACFKDGKLVLIEVKPKRSHRLKLWQHKIMLELVKHGIRCYRWSPDGGFEPVIEHIKFPINLP